MDFSPYEFKSGNSRVDATKSISSEKILDLLPETRWLLVLLAPLIAEKFIQVFIAPPRPDEAYYWLWGQHLALSYFDHPPLFAWLQRLSAELFGWNLFGLRAISLFSFCGSLAILWYWSQRFLPQHAWRLFLAGSLTWLAMPFLMFFQSYAHQDSLLIFLCLFTAHFFALFRESLEQTQPSWRFFVAGSVALGFAGLTKYNAVFLGLGFASFIILSQNGRQLLKDWRLWAGAGISITIQAPTLIWNIQNGWLSFHYNLYARIGNEQLGGPIGNIAIFVIGSVVMLSPYAAFGLFRFLSGKSPICTPFIEIGRHIFILSTIVFLLICLRNWVLPYWNLPAYIFALPVIVLFMKSRWHVIANAIYGTVISGFLVVGVHTIPIYKVFGVDNRDTDIVFGWRAITSIVEEEEDRLKPDLVVTTDYRTASLLAFTAKRLDIHKIGLRGDQYDLWFDPAKHKGKSALILVDDYVAETELVTKVFGKVTPVREIEITELGQTVKTYRLVWAEDYSGAGPH